MFLINLSGKQSIYEQIRDQIVSFIEKGILKPNDKLPSVRELAAELGINPNTVMKAYQELEANGYIYTVTKKGAFICQDIETRKQLSKNDALMMLNSLKNEGFNEDELVSLVKQVYGGKTC